MSIDWAALGLGKNIKPQSFTAAQINDAVAAAKKLPALGNDPNKVATPWPKPDEMPTITDVDFGDVKEAQVTIADLLASNRSLKRDRLIWHIQHPGQAKNPSVFTSHPLVLGLKNDQIIIDGHHRLAALQMLGATQTTAWLLPPT